MRLRARTPPLRSEAGFGLVELVLSMAMLNVGILALVAAFQSGAFALQRASKLSTASTLADIQMERYRALTYEAVVLDIAALTDAQADSTYTGDVAYASDQVAATCAEPTPEECEPLRTLLGPDNKRYRVDTYIVVDTVDTSRQFKRVTIVVRDASTLAGAPLARLASTFDASTGVTGG